MLVSEVEQHVYLAACDGVDEPDPDRAPLSAALADAGIRAAWPAWTDPSVDWSAAAVCFPRATWDYHLDLAAFLRWAEHVDAVCRLRNGLDVIRWNTHKSYLVELAARGVATVPTRVVAARAAVAVDDVRREMNWDNVVVKPAVSCASWHTYSTSDVEDIDPVWARLLGERDMLIQPFVPSVKTLGERSVVVVDGSITHVIRKEPRFEGQRERVTGPLAPTAAERAVVEAALGCVEADLDYARVDLVADEEGGPMVAELELVEPSLYFTYSPEALQRFVELVARYIQQS